MKMQLTRPVILLLALLFPSLPGFAGSPFKTDIFPPQGEHVHGSTVTECPNGDLLAAWFQGSGERWADDVRIMGSRLEKGLDRWSEPFLMADVPGFPDINPVLFVDRKEELWLVWYTVIANQWETSLLKFRKSREYMGRGAPVWYWQDDLLVKPGGPAERGIQPGDPFVESVKRQLGELDSLRQENDPGQPPEAGSGREEEWSRRKRDLLDKAAGMDMIRDGRRFKPDGTYAEEPLGYPYYRRMGWQTRNKPFQDDARIVLPLYSDGFSFSLMAITENLGASWSFSRPLVENGNIQPAIARKADGTLVAFMRDNGPRPKRLHLAESPDRGDTWSLVRDSNIPNPGSGADVLTLANGHWILVFNDREEGRNSLAVSVSRDEGGTWSDPVKLEFDVRPQNPARSHYPAIVQGRDGTLHVVYSYHLNRPEGTRKTIRYASFTEEWALGN